MSFPESFGASTGATALYGGSGAGAQTGGGLGGYAGLFNQIGMGATVGGSFLGAAGAWNAGAASAAADNYRAQIALNNQQIAKQNAAWQTQAGEAQVAEAGMKTRATVGAEKAAQAAGGVDVTSGSAVDVRSSSAALGELNALTIRSNTSRQVYGSEIEAQSQGEQATLDKLAAKNDSFAGLLGVTKSLLGGASSVGNQYAKWQEAAGSGSSLASWF